VEGPEGFSGKVISMNFKAGQVADDDTKP